MPRTCFYDKIAKHPMENLKENGLMHEEQLKMTSYGQLFGSHVPMKLMIERNMLGQQRRLPGEKSSLLGRTFIKNILFF